MLGKSAVDSKSEIEESLSCNEKIQLPIHSDIYSKYIIIGSFKTWFSWLKSILQVTNPPST